MKITYYYKLQLNYVSSIVFACGKNKDVDDVINKTNLKTVALSHGLQIC